MPKCSLSVYIVTTLPPYCIFWSVTSSGASRRESLSLSNNGLQGLMSIKFKLCQSVLYLYNCDHTPMPSLHSVSDIFKATFIPCYFCLLFLSFPHIIAPPLPPLSLSPPSHLPRHSVPSTAPQIWRLCSTSLTPLRPTSPLLSWTMLLPLSTTTLAREPLASCQLH